MCAGPKNDVIIAHFFPQQRLRFFAHFFWGGPPSAFSFRFLSFKYLANNFLKHFSGIDVFEWGSGAYFLIILWLSPFRFICSICQGNVSGLDNWGKMLNPKARDCPPSENREWKSGDWGGASLDVNMNVARHAKYVYAGGNMRWERGQNMRK